MTRHVIARTVQDGPVVLGQYQTVTGQRRAYRAALATFRDGGFDRDVVGIEMDSGEPGHGTPAPEWPSANVQLGLL